MRRREFVGALAAAGLFPRLSLGQERPARFADMHAHASRRQGLSRESLRRQGMLVVAETVVPDTGLLRRMGNRLGAIRDARPGEMRHSFQVQFDRVRMNVEDEGLPVVTSAAALARILRERTPAIVLASEGADFLEGEIEYLEKVRAVGLAHLQLVHYRISDIGDISTEEPKHGGLTEFGKDAVRACNRLGILVDVAHCTTDGTEQVLEASSKPVVYSHGHVRANPPSASLGGIAARAIHLPLAKKLAAKGGVVGIWPLGAMYASREAYSDALVRAADDLGAAHVGIGSDINGLPRNVVPTHEEFAEVAELLAKRGLKETDVAGIMGENYIRVLRQALTL